MFFDFCVKRDLDRYFLIEKHEPYRSNKNIFSVFAQKARTKLKKVTYLSFKTGKKWHRKHSLNVLWDSRILLREQRLKRPNVLFVIAYVFIDE